MNRLEKHYNEVIIPEFLKKGIFSNIMAVPRLVKIVVNISFGNIMSNKKLIDNVLSELSLITGQKPVIINSRKSIAGFKLRKGFPIGCKVTLRKDRMYDFFDELLSVVLPRVRDFRGLSIKSFDGYGNYNLGIKEQIVFPEIDYEKIDSLRGMDITIVTTALNNKDSELLLRSFSFPFV